MAFRKLLQERHVYFAPKGAAVEKARSDYKHFAPDGARIKELGRKGTSNHDDEG